MPKIISETLHQAMPVRGYTSQSDEAVDLVNHNKLLEEECLRALDELANNPAIDKRWLAIGRTNLEQAWMAINRSIFKPKRIADT